MLSTLIYKLKKKGDFFFRKWESIDKANEQDV